MTSASSLWSVIRCIRVLANFGREHSVAVRKRCWVQDGLWSDQSCPLPTFNSSVRVERSFAICYLNVVIKPLCGNLDICLNYYFRSRTSVRLLSVADSDRKWKMLFCIALFGHAVAQSSKTRACECTYFHGGEVVSCSLPLYILIGGRST